MITDTSLTARLLAYVRARAAVSAYGAVPRHELAATLGVNPVVVDCLVESLLARGMVRLVGPGRDVRAVV